jgi:hypothetical protein
VDHIARVAKVATAETKINSSDAEGSTRAEPIDMLLQFVKHRIFCQKLGPEHAFKPLLLFMKCAFP